MAEIDAEPTVDSRLAFEGKIINVRVDTVRMPNGNLATREIVEHSQCVCVVPLDEQRNVIMVRQYRKPTEENLLEVPAGNVDPGEEPGQTVVRELKEETGYTADKMEYLCSFWTTPGFTNELMHAYMATGLHPGATHLDEDEILHSVKVPLEEVPGMIRSGEIRDAKSIASLMLVLSSS